jgi:hypothetical protein
MSALECPLQQVIRFSYPITIVNHVSIVLNGSGLPAEAELTWPVYNASRKSEKKDQMRRHMTTKSRKMRRSG